MQDLKRKLTFDIPSVKDYVNITRDLSAPIRAILHHEPINTQEEIWMQLLM
jgi:hypothetical protein